MNTLEGDPVQPQYHLPELPRLNKSKIGFNWAGGAGWVKRSEGRGQRAEGQWTEVSESEDRGRRKEKTTGRRSDELIEAIYR